MLYGSSYVATAIALRSFSPLGTAASRGVLGALAVAAVLLLPIAPRLRAAPRGAAGFVRLLILASLGGPLFIGAMSFAVAMAGATITAFVAGLYAVLAAVLAIPLLGERPDPRTVLALVVALAGTAMLAELQLTGEAVAGIGVGLAAAVCFGLFLVLSRRWSATYRLAGPAVALSALGMTGALIGAALAIIGQAPLADPLRVDAGMAIAWLAVGPGALAAVLIVAGMERIPARRASAFLLLNPPTAAIGSWLLLGERLSPIQLLGGALVLLSIAGASGISLIRPRAGRNSDPGSQSSP